jgi:4-hydroxy-tetrahydrodipicolinate synthase
MVCSILAKEVSAMSIPVFDTDRFDRYYCALVTPYKPDSLEIDLDAFRKFVRYFTTNKDFLKIKGALIANPEASEMFYMTPEERAELIKVVIAERPSDMPIFCGAYGVRPDEVVASALQAKSLGVDGIFVFPPTGTMEVGTAIDGAQNPEIWTGHVKTIAEATQLPLIPHPAHPHTAEWGGALPLQSVRMLLEEVPSVVGYKMIYGKDSAHFRIARFIRSLPRHVGILNAPHYCHHTAVICGLLDGMVQGAFNWNMEGMVSHTLAWQAGDMKLVREIFTTQVLPLWEFIYSNASRLHIRYKLATWIRGLISHPFMRPPMPVPRQEEAEVIYQLILKTGQSIINRSEFEKTLQRKDQILAKGVPHLKKNY